MGKVLPQTIFLKYEGEDENEDLYTFVTLQDAAETKEMEVGEYRLVKVRKVQLIATEVK